MEQQRLHDGRLAVSQGRRKGDLVSEKKCVLCFFLLGFFFCETDILFFAGYG